ncbi:MAG TPA: hypothetical protein VN962_16710 [Polyangia bacterium]|nr:hypothetical protein [Polyangia bacterium]
MQTRDDEQLGPLDRLVEGAVHQPGGDPGTHARAVELVQSLDPFHLSLGRKQRLLMSLGHGSVPRRRLALRPILVAVLLMGSGAVASAALTKWPSALLRSCQTLVSRRADPVPAPRPQPVRGGLAPAPVPADEPIVAMPAHAPETVRRASTEAHSRRPVVRPPSEDPVLLIQAARALRADRDPKRARALAARYLDQHPRGALADEALAISIEAAVDHHDPDAAALSARYLAQFPRGSFRALAERTLAPPDLR